MNDIETDISTSVCRYCRFYEPEGRRGGSCQKLGVPVESKWKACTLASLPFKTTLTKLEEIFQLNYTVELASDTFKADVKDDRSKIDSKTTEQIR